MSDKKYDKEVLIKAGVDLVKILVDMTMTETDGNSALRAYLKELTSETGIYKKQKDAIEAMTQASNRFEEKTKAVDEKNHTNTEQIEFVCNNFEQMIKNIQSITSRQDILNEKVTELNKSISEINSFVQSIQKVAKQTNLLSFNASIEAARAGVAGKGFRIIASEVKKLSNETTSMSENIARQISELKDNIHNLIAENESTINFIKEFKNIVVASNDTLENVKKDSQLITEFTDSIVNEVSINKEHVFASAEEVEKQNIYQVKNLANQAADEAISVNDKLSFLFELKYLFEYMKENINEL